MILLINIDVTQPVFFIHVLNIFEINLKYGIKN